MLLIMLAPLALAAYLADHYLSASPEPLAVQHVVGLALLTAVGPLWVYSGRCWWRLQWRIATIATLAAYLLGVLAASLAWPGMGP